MKTKKCFILTLLAILLLFTNRFSYAQEDFSTFISNSCAMNYVVNPLESYPIKPPVTGEHYMKIIIVYVMFNNETQDPNNQEWPANTTTGPSWKGTMLAQEKNAISDWWNAYNTETQSISSWFCENSRGQTHVIGNEYFIKLPISAQEYIDNYKYQWQRENAINTYIYENLTTNQGVNWADYDNWSYSTNSGWSWGSDNAVDMIYKIHRYKYSDIFSFADASGYAALGYGSNTSNQFIYTIIQNNIPYNFIGAFPYVEGNAGSGLTVVGNGTSGVLDKWGAFGRLMHEHGHYLLGGGHGNVGMMGDVWDLSYSPWEKIALGYITPTDFLIENNPYNEVVLDDISARTSNRNHLLRVYTTNGHFLIANRYKVSRWDRPMQGDVAHFGLDTYHGKGTYIYHNCLYYHPNRYIDIECADGLWKWVQNGYDAPDWDPNNPWLCVLNKTEPVKFPNDQNDDGIGRNINNPQYQNSAKDGLTVLGTALTTPPRDCQKWFSIGKKGNNGYGCGTDRIETNYEENWTSREFQVDRWDAWKPTYNEIFSPYSSPSTITWNGSPSGLFIWIKNYEETTNQTTVRIYRDVVYNPGGMLETDILAATPPSRPMGIKTDYHWVSETLCHPKITWVNNTEPDVINPSTGKIRYKLYRAYKLYMNQIPGPPVLIENNLEFYPNETPTYIDYQIIGYQSILSGDEPWLYPVRYWVKVVDNSNDESVFSDFTSAIGINDGSVPIGGSGSDNLISNKNIPKQFALSQNYPNPFNPITNIKYDLPKDIFVTIKIYDMLGREIKTLVNEFKNAGSYVVSFNGSELASGIYFYRIQAGDFASVKRMVLIK